MSINTTKESVYRLQKNSVSDAMALQRASLAAYSPTSKSATYQTGVKRKAREAAIMAPTTKEQSEALQDLLEMDSTQYTGEPLSAAEVLARKMLIIMQSLRRAQNIELASTEKDIA